MTVSVKPVVKWVGGKGGILDKLLERLPDNYVFYYELFGGGAALRLALPPQRYAMVADANQHLIRSYSMIVNDCASVASGLANYREEYLAGRWGDRKVMFNRIRCEFRLDASTWTGGPLQAARFIFLNKTGFNGLYRENQAGEYNVSFGYYERPALDPDNLYAFSLALAGTKPGCRISCGRWSSTRKESSEARTSQTASFAKCDNPKTLVLGCNLLAFRIGAYWS